MDCRALVLGTMGGRTKKAVTFATCLGPRKRALAVVIASVFVCQKHCAVVIACELGGLLADCCSRSVVEPLMWTMLAGSVLVCVVAGLSGLTDLLCWAQLCGCE